MQLQKTRIRIFISAYACEPNLGSEIGVGWHWVLEMSKYFELWVLTRNSNRMSIEPWLTNHPEYRNIHFIYYDWSRWARFWKKGLRGVRLYYCLWQFCTNHIVKQTMQKNNIKIYHLLTYGNILWPASSYGQRQFFIWGPVGGAETIPKDYSQYYDWRGRCLESLRRYLIKCLSLNIGFQKRCKNANLILCKSYATYDAIPHKYKKKATLFTDVAVETTKLPYKTQPRAFNENMTLFLMVGRLDAWRGFDLAIEAMSIAVKKDNNIHLDIVGDGFDRKRIIRWIEKYDIRKHVTLHGQVSLAMYYQKMANCDVVLNMCLKEGAVTTAFDSLFFGKPLICIDTGGYTRYFNENFAIVIPLGKRQETIEKVADSMINLTNPVARKHLSQAALTAGCSYNWEVKGKDIRQLITDLFHES